MAGAGKIVQRVGVVAFAGPAAFHVRDEAAGIGGSERAHADIASKAMLIRIWSAANGTVR